MPAKNVKAKLVIEIGNEKLNFEKEHTSLAEVKERLISYLDTLIAGEYRNHVSELRMEESRLPEKERVFEPEFLPKWLKDYDIESLTQKDKVLLLIKNEYRDGWIKSQEMREKYRDVFGDDVKLSSVSTYLARFHEEGVLERKGSRAQREYKLAGLATA